MDLEQDNAFLKLPPELLHNVLRFLPHHVILRARLTCHRLAYVGADHVLKEVVTAFTRAKYQNLWDLGSHPYLAAKVKDLYFQVDRLQEPALSFREWNRQRVCERPDTQWAAARKALPALRGNCSSRSWLRNIYDAITSIDQADPVVTNAHETYLALVEDQHAIAVSRFDLECLIGFFSGCSNLESVTLAIRKGTKWRSTHRWKPCYGETWLPPYGDVIDACESVYQFWSVLEALLRTGRRLQRFTATALSMRILANPDPQVPAMLSNLTGSLRELRLRLSQHHDALACYRTEEESTEESAIAKLVLPLARAQQLRVLKLNGGLNSDLAVVQRVLSVATWPFLHTLGLAQTSVSENVMVDFLLRHKDHLQCLLLDHISLYQGSWTSIFTRVSCRMTKLRKFDIRGRLGPFDLGYTDCECPEPKFRRAIEAFVLNGGDLAEFTALLTSPPDEVIRGWDDDLSDYDEEVPEPNRCEQCVSCGRRDAEPLFSYDSDAFDELAHRSDTPSGWRSYMDDRAIKIMKLQVSQSS